MCIVARVTLKKSPYNQALGAPIGTETSRLSAHLLADTDVPFVLTRGGLSASIVSEPGHQSRPYRIYTTGSTDAYRDPDVWLGQARVEEGSWRPDWHS